MTPNRDEATEKTLVELITPGIYSADATGTLIDLIDFQAATLLIHVGAGGIAFSGANKIEFVLAEGDLADGSDLAPVADLALIKDTFCPASVSGGIVRSITSAKAAADVQKLGYIGGKRFLKLVADFSGAHGTGTPISAVLVQEEGILQGAA